MTHPPPATRRPPPARMNSTWFHVALLYAVAVWLARRFGGNFPWRIAGLFYALVLIFLWRPLTGPYVNLPVDVVQTLPPWSSMIRDHHVANFEMNDIVMQIVPWADQVRQSWKSLHFPLWNALSGSGYPLLANGQSSGLSPIRLLALPLPLGYAFAAEAAMKILIAMSFMFAFCRRRWSELASAFGAVCFGYCNAALSFGINFAATAVDSQPAGSIPRPLTQYIVPLLIHGHFSPGVPITLPGAAAAFTGHTSVNLATFDEVVVFQRHPAGSWATEWASFNLGEPFFGVGDSRSLFPIGLVILFGGAAIGWKTRSITRSS